MIPIILLALSALMFVALFPLAILWLHNEAVLKHRATYVRSNTIELVVAGESLSQILENVPGYYYQKGNKDSNDNPLMYRTKVGRMITPEVRDAEGKITTPALWEFHEVLVPVSDAIVPGDPKYISLKPWRDYFRRRWGFFWVSWAYPQTHIHKFSILKVRLRPDFGQTDEPLSNIIDVDEELTEVDNLRFEFPRPILLNKVEFADKLTVSFVVMIKFRVVMPRIPAFDLKESFFPSIESMVGNAIMNFCLKLKLTDFIAESPIGEKADVHMGFFARVVSQINPAMILHFGVEATTAFLVDIVLGDEAQRKALKAQELAELEGLAAVKKAQKDAEAKVAESEGEKQAAIKKAEGGRIAKVELSKGEAEATVIAAKADAQARRLKGNAEAAVLKAKVKAAGQEVVIAEFNVARVGAFNGDTYVEGGASTGIILNPSSAPRNRQRGGEPEEQPEEQATANPPAGQN